jgi:hypothetical protein
MPIDTRARTPNQIARRLRVGIHKVLGWIKSGELRAVNVARDTGRRPQWSVLPEDLADFERRRAAVPATKPTRCRRRKHQDVIEFF